MPPSCATRSSACARRQTRNNMTTRKELLPGVFLTSIQDGRFKTACFSLSFLRPLRAGEAAMNALLPSVLLRGREKTPSIRAIADRLDELHGASIGALVRKKGEIQLTGLFADCLEDQYAGEAVFSHLLDFVSELLFCPRTEHGAFVLVFVLLVLKPLNSWLPDKRKSLF